MIWALVLLVLVLLFVAAPRIVSGLASGSLFTPAHLAELGAKVLRSRTAALEGIVRSEMEEEDPKKALERGAAFVTSRGIGMMYTIAERDGAYEHHLSTSARGRPLPRAATSTLLVFVRRVLGLGGPCELGTAEGGVVHVTVRLEPKAHAAYAAKELAPPDASTCARLLSECLASHERSSFVAMLGSRPGER